MKKEKKFKNQVLKIHKKIMDKNPEQYCLPFNLASQLKEIGYDEPCMFGFDSFKKLRSKVSSTNEGAKISWDKHDNHMKAPTRDEVFKWFRDVHGLYVRNQPEFYTTGINFNWQILWYLPKEEWKYDEENRPFLIETGTFMYGDNAEFPTQEAADLGMIEKMIGIVIVKNKINEKNKV